MDLKRKSASGLLRESAWSSYLPEEPKTDISKIQKQQLENDRNAEVFLADFLILLLMHVKLGDGGYKRLLANAVATFREAVILTGISDVALKSVAKNVFNRSETDLFPLIELAELTSKETVLAWILHFRQSYKSHVRKYIQDCVKSEHGEILFELCSEYFNREENEAKIFEVKVHVMAGYFKMYPPQHDDLIAITKFRESVFLERAISALFRYKNTSEQENPATAGVQTEPDRLPQGGSLPEISAQIIPRHLWENKSAQQVCNDMRAAGYTEDGPIAVVLRDFVGIKNYTEIGTILRGNALTESGRAKHARKKYDEAKGSFFTM